MLYTENNKYNVGHIDLIGGGSCCQDFSFINNSKHKYGLEGNKSSLFFEYLRLLKEVKPTYFLLENVRMKKDSKEALDNYLGVVGIEINSKLVSYQNRPRIYWTNIPNVVIPKDRNISFQDYIEKDTRECKKYKLNKGGWSIRAWNNGNGKNNISTGCANITHSNKIYCLTTKQSRIPNSGLIECGDFCRYLTRRDRTSTDVAYRIYRYVIIYTDAKGLR